MGYLRPTDGYTLSSHAAHKRRNPPSQEAGTDIWSDFGTPLRAPADGVVVEVGGSIYAATGYFVTIDLDDGRRIRFLHLWDRYVFRGQRVSRGTVFAQSGGSGYGSMYAAGGAGTVGRHVHVTLWPSHSYSFGTNANTLDFEQYADPIGSNPAPAGQKEEEDMTPEQAEQLSDIAEAITKLVNAVTDPANGAHHWANEAAGAAQRGEELGKGTQAAVSNVEKILSDVRNAIADPKIGVLVASNEARASSAAALSAVGKLSVGGGKIDVDALAKSIRKDLGADLARALAERLAD